MEALQPLCAPWAFEKVSLPDQLHRTNRFGPQMEAWESFVLLIGRCDRTGHQKNISRLGLIPEMFKNIKSLSKPAISEWPQDHKQDDAHHQECRDFVGKAVKTRRTRVAVSREILAPLRQRLMEHGQQHHA